MPKRPISSIVTFTQASRIHSKSIHRAFLPVFFLKTLPTAMLHCDVGTAICIRTSFHLFQNFFEKRLLLPLTLLSFLFS